MNYRWIKYFRVFIAAIFIILSALAFLDFKGFLPNSLIKNVFWIQFVPSLLTFLRVFTLAGAGFFLVLIITSIFGRFYCAAICPLGILQDIILRISKSFSKTKFHYQKPIKYIRHIILGITAITFLFGSLLMLNFLDPYSIFGRIFSDLLRPVGMAANNFAVDILHTFDNYSLYYVDLYVLNWTIYLVPLFFLGLIIILSLKHGRIYCNTVCPVGTLLGYISRYSLFRIRIDNNLCTNCKKCEQVCKAECISLTTQEIDHSRCIACYNCLTVCKFDAIDLTWKQKNHSGSVIENTGRRQALKTIAGGLFFFPLTAVGEEQELYYTATVPVKRDQHATPPGSADVADFLNKCTACHLCVSSCPTRVIQPASDQFGWQHFMQVRMDYWAGYCTYECTRCTEVCPTGALLPLNVADKKLTQLGQVCFVADNCIVKTEGTDCGSCAEHCPTKAVYMVPYQNDLRIPEINKNICIGCGACEHACPTRPYKAIYVEGNQVHVLAQKPKENQAEKPDHDEGFPF